jgi:hypothetical protein
VLLLVLVGFGNDSTGFGNRTVDVFGVKEGLIGGFGSAAARGSKIR